MEARPLFRLLCLLVAVVVWTAPPALGQEVQDEKEKIRKRLLEDLTEAMQQYESQLQAVLKTRFPEEKDFVTQIVFMVQEEKLPKNLVDSAWLWVREKRPGTGYPFVYFERVLRLQAERLKLEVPPFDRRIYERASRRFSDADFGREIK
jgi:hypothetical protein